jgi:hypothetical protein
MLDRITAIMNRDSRGKATDIARVARRMPNLDVVNPWKGKPGTRYRIERTGLRIRTLEPAMNQP